MLVTLLSVASMVVWAFSRALIDALAFWPDDVRHGWVWQLATWPLANPPTFFGALTIFFFWYFGSQLEDQLGRARMARFLVLLTLGLSVLGLLISAPFGFTEPVLYGLGSLELIVLLVWIAEHPHARFFFGIPAWLLGVVLVAIPVLQMLGTGQLLLLLHLLLGLVLAAVVARAFGLLSEVEFIPKLAGAGPRRAPRRPSGRASRRQRRSGGPGSVVAGPWAGSSSPVSSDQAKLDALLDKIHAGGMDSLTAKEREQLVTLSRRLRGE